jgi:hypothetical protein
VAIRLKNVKANFSLSTLLRHIRAVELQLHLFLTSSLDGGEWLTSQPGHFTPGEEPRYPQNRRFQGSHSQPGHSREEKILLPILAFEALSD